jgi:hypothetical protein
MLPRRFSSITKFHDVKTYLRYAQFNETNAGSTVFNGTLYEFTVKEQLEHHFQMSKLTHYGGSYDNGKDLGGQWDISTFQECSAPQSIRVRGRKVKPTLLRKSSIMDLLIQCKCFSSKITAKEIRELAGIFNFNVRPVNRYTTLGVMCSPSTLTAQGHEQMDRSEIPLMFCQVTRMKPGSDPYDPEALSRSEVLGCYMNPLTVALLQGTSLVSGVDLSQ